MNYEQLFAEQKRLENRITDLKQQLQKYPEGRLICTHNQNYYKWYHSINHEQIYIPKKNRKLAEALAIKKYLSLQYQEALHKKQAIDQYLKCLSTHSYKYQDLLKPDSPYQELLTPYFKSFSQELLDWTNYSYEHNSKYPEQLIHKSNSGHLVRSKSELLIDMALYTHQIPFRYECALHLGEITLYPDFTIRHPITGEIFYWEHFGLMDEATYSKNTFNKLQLYAAHGIIPTIHLITSYETKSHPLNPDNVTSIITNYFLT